METDLAPFIPTGGGKTAGDLVDLESCFTQGRLRAWRQVALPETGAPQGWLGVAAEAENLPEAVARINQGVMLALAAAVLLAGLFSLFLVRWLGRSMEALISVSEAIGQGRYRERARRFSSRELDALSRSINHMAGSIQEQIRVITEQKEQFEAVLNSMNEGVMVLDASCRIRSVNRALTRIFPECRNCEGRHPLELISSPELQRACLDVTRDTHRGLRSFQIEPRKDAVYDVAIVSLVKEGRGPNDLGAVAVFHDISTLSRLERVRSDFVANVSHELRTPLTSIKGYAETLLAGLQQGQVDEKSQRNFLEIILRNANHMAKMVNDLLNLARREGDRKPFATERVDAAEALAEALKECAIPLAEQAIVLDNRLDSGAAVVLADKDRLVQVLRNLLENAMKYGLPPDPAETQQITVWSESWEESVLFALRDNGPGIPKEERKRIFERFYRVEKHRAKNAAGSSGLGLAITKHMVEKMGGEIWVDSPARHGQGITFFFTLPGPEAMVRDEAETVAPQAAQQQE